MNLSTPSLSDYDTSPCIWTDEDDYQLLAAIEACEEYSIHGRISWIKVSEYLKGTKTPNQCNYRYNAFLKYDNTEKKSGCWSPEEDEALKQAVELFEGQGNNGGVSWSKVSDYLGGYRKPEQCHWRWNSALRYMSDVLKTGPWTEEDDNQLREAVKKYEGQGKGGKIPWTKITEQMGGIKTRSQCKYRWYSFMKRDQVAVANGAWEPEEDRKLAEAVALHAPSDGQQGWGRVSWGRVSAHLQHSRTSQQCKRRWAVLCSEKERKAELHSWGEEDDEILSKAVEQNRSSGRAGGVSWVRVAEALGNKWTPAQCSARYRHKRMTSGTTTGNVKHGVWVEQENDLLLDGIEQHTHPETGAIDWECVSRHLKGTRLPNQCRRRWEEVLKYEKHCRRGPWVSEEDDKLIAAVVATGSKKMRWDKICAHMGMIRRASQCKHRWFSVLRDRPDVKRMLSGEDPAPGTVPSAAPMSAVPLPPPLPAPLPAPMASLLPPGQIPMTSRFPSPPVLQSQLPDRSQVVAISGTVTADPVVSAPSSDIGTEEVGNKRKRPPLDGVIAL